MADVSGIGGGSVVCLLGWDAVLCRGTQTSWIAADVSAQTGAVIVHVPIAGSKPLLVSTSSAVHVDRQRSPASLGVESVCNVPYQHGLVKACPRPSSKLQGCLVLLRAGCSIWPQRLPDISVSRHQCFVSPFGRKVHLQAANSSRHELWYRLERWNLQSRMTLGKLRQQHH